MDCVVTPEGITEKTNAIVNAVIKTEIGRDLHHTTDNRLSTQDIEIRALSEDQVDLSRHIVKIKDGLFQVHTTLDAKSETLTKINGVQGYILARLVRFSTAKVQVNARLTRIKTAPPTVCVPEIPCTSDLSAYVGPMRQVPTWDFAIPLKWGNELGVKMGPHGSGGYVPHHRYDNLIRTDLN